MEEWCTRVGFMKEFRVCIVWCARAPRVQSDPGNQFTILNILIFEHKSEKGLDCGLHTVLKICSPPSGPLSPVRCAHTLSRLPSTSHL